jgi:hypothetical protein
MKITTKEYIDNQTQWMVKYIDSRFNSNERAVEKYSETNDEWKGTHNNLQRKMDTNAKEFIRAPQLWAIVVGVATFCLGIAMYLKKN